MDALLRDAVIALIGIAYFIPALMAHAMHHRQETSIVLLNLLLGWTGIGWIAAILWSVATRPATAVLRLAESVPDSGFCADCGSPLEARASFCPACGFRSPMTPATR